MMGVVCVSVVFISRHLIQELVWATDEWLRLLIIYVVLFKAVIPPSN